VGGSSVLGNTTGRRDARLLQVLSLPISVLVASLRIYPRCPSPTWSPVRDCPAALAHTRPLPATHPTRRRRRRRRTGSGWAKRQLLHSMSIVWTSIVPLVHSVHRDHILNVESVLTSTYLHTPLLEALSAVPGKTWMSWRAIWRRET